MPDICLTSKVRPTMRSASALCVYTATSGSIPASVHDGGSPGLWLDGGKRDELVCFVVSFSEVYSAFIRDRCVFLPSVGVLCKIMYYDRLLLM
jgi:hypothetical protein